MKTLRFQDYPTSLARTEYDNVIDRVLAHLSGLEIVRGVYQAGAVREPGISDLDLICVFQNTGSLTVNIHNLLPEQDRRVLTHGLFGIRHDDICDARRFNFISGIKHLAGTDETARFFSCETEKEVKKQLALEYLLKMYFTLAIQLRYGVIKLRSFLLEARALLFDLELLDYQHHPLYQLIKDVILVRQRWFIEQPPDKELSKLVFAVQANLTQLLLELLSEQDFYLPDHGLKVAKNIRLEQAAHLSIQCQGISLPQMLSFLGKRFYSIQNRLNDYVVQVPFSVPASDSIYAQRFQYYERIRTDHNRHLPHFIPFTSSLRLFYESR